MFGRWFEPLWKKKFAAPFVHIVFGARQTGKSTLLRALLPDAAIRHLLAFLAEHPKQARHGYLICRCRHPLALHKYITALPWYAL